MPNRYDELTDTEKVFFDGYINTVANAGTPEFVEKIKYWLDQVADNCDGNGDYRHAMAMVRHHLATLEVPDLLDREKQATYDV